MDADLLGLFEVCRWICEFISVFSVAVGVFCALLWRVAPHFAFESLAHAAFESALAHSAASVRVTMLDCCVS